MRAHNLYKSLYIKSLLENVTKERKIEILKGLIASAKKLSLPYKEYQSELNDLLGNSPKKQNFKKPTLKQNRLTKIILRKGYVEFYFDYPLKKSDFGFFKQRKGRRYRNVYEVKGRLLGAKKSYRLKSVDRLVVVQYTKEKIRIIFEDDKPIFTRKVLKGSKLEIHLSKKSFERSSKGYEPKQKVKVPQVILNSKKIIVIDPGHGGKDSGAIGYKRKREKDIVLAIAKKLYATLKKQGYKVYLTRKGDYFVTLRNRTRFANRVKANLFISIHANAAPTKSKRLAMKGLETFFLSPTRSERAKRVAALENRVEMRNLSYFSKQVYLDFLNREKTILSNKLAIDIQRNILANVRKRYSLVDGGVRPGPFWVLVGAQMPAVLIEVGYITNPTEAKRLSSPYYQKLIAEGIAKGIESYFIHNQK